MEIEKDDSEFYDREIEDDDPGCVLGDRCCMPNPDHFSFECFTAEMAEAYMKEGLESARRQGATEAK